MFDFRTFGGGGGKANLSTSIRHIKRATFATLITNLLTGARFGMPGSSGMPGS